MRNVYEHIGTTIINCLRKDVDEYTFLCLYDLATQVQGLQNSLDRFVCSDYRAGSGDKYFYITPKDADYLGLFMAGIEGVKPNTVAEIRQNATIEADHSHLLNVGLDSYDEDCWNDEPRKEGFFEEHERLFGPGGGACDCGHGDPCYDCNLGLDN